MHKKGWIACIMAAGILFSVPVSGDTQDAADVSVGDTTTVYSEEGNYSKVQDGTVNADTETSETEETAGGDGTYGGTEEGDGSAGETVPVPTMTAEELARQNAIADVNQKYLAIMNAFQNMLNSISTQPFGTFGGGASSLNLNTISAGGLRSEDITKLQKLVGEYQQSLTNPDLPDDYDPRDYGQYNDKTDENADLPSKEAYTDPSVSGLTEEEIRKAMQEIAAAMGLSFDGSAQSFTLQAGVGLGERQNLDHALPMVYTIDGQTGQFRCFSEIPGMSPLNYWTGVRKDLYSGGLNDGPSRVQRVRSLYGYLSNSLFTRCMLVSMKNLHLENVTESEMNIIDYTSDVRYWHIIDLSDNSTVAVVKTTSPEHRLDYTWTKDGSYKIECYRDCIYSYEKTVEFRQYDYLFDAATGNIMYFTECSTTTPVTISSEEKASDQPVHTSDDDWYVNVKDLQAETTGKSTERTK